MHGHFRLRVALASVAFVVATLGHSATAADTVRPEVGNPLKAAQSLTKSGKHREALVRIGEADAVSGKTAYESFLIQQMRGSVAAVAGDTETAIRSFEAVVASGRLTGAEQLRMIQAVASLHYRNKDYQKAATWAARYRKEGGRDPSMRTVLLQSYYFNNDCANVSRLVGDVSAESGNGKKATEEELQILANCHLKQKDTNGYVAAIEKLVIHYPKKEYWTDLLNRVQKKQGFSDRLALDVFRLKSATGNIASSDDYMEYAQLALQGGFPAEAKIVVDKAYEKGVFGNGKEADRQKRLKDLVQKQLDELQKTRAQVEKAAQTATDGGDLVKVGVNYVYEGQGDKGVKLIEQGIKKGGLRRPEDAKLQLGEALIQAGNRGRAVTVLKGVQGADGTADLARLWTLHAQRS